MNLRESLEQQQEKIKSGTERVTVWTPQEGEILVGELLNVQEVETKFGSRRIAGILDEETGKVVEVWLSHKVLQNEFDRYSPQPGDRVGIKFLGLRKGTREEYYNYKVLVERRDQAEEDEGDDGAQETEDEAPF